MNIRLCLLAAIVLPLAACAQSVGAPDSRAPAAATAAAATATAAVPAGDPRIALAAKIPGTRPEDLRSTPVPGIFELAHGGEVSYVTADAGYVFSGDLYKVGMAVAPVPDQRLYDTIYQERYMGLPQDNPDGYRDGSPIHFAEGLKGRLLLVHGSGDDNVHFQGTERLVNALVAANRPFTLMEYPNRSHCICEGKGTTLHLYSLLTRYLEQNVPPGPRGATPASH